MIGPHKGGSPSLEKIKFELIEEKLCDCEWKSLESLACKMLVIHLKLNLQSNYTEKQIELVSERKT